MTAMIVKYGQRKNRSIVGAVALLLLPLGPAAAAGEPQAAAGANEPAASAIVLDRVVASLDGEPISMSDLDKHIQSIGEEKREHASRDDLQRYLRDLLVLQMLRKEAVEAGVVVGDEEIEAYLAEIKGQNNVDDQGFREILAGKGLTYEDYLGQVRADIIRARILNMRVRAKINVVDEDIDRYLAERPNLTPKDGEVRIEQVLIPAGENQSAAAAREELQGIRDRVAAGASLPTLGGKHYSDLGFMKPADLKEQLRAAVEKLDSGELSEVLDTPRGPVLLRVTAPGETAASSITPELREQIRQQIFQSRFQEETKRYLSEDLPKKYHVEIKL